MTVEEVKREITNSPEEHLIVGYNGNNFQLIKDTNYYPLYIKEQNIIELKILEAQKLARFIQDCIVGK